MEDRSEGLIDKGSKGKAADACGDDHGGAYDHCRNDYTKRQSVEDIFKCSPRSSKILVLKPDAQFPSV